MSSDVDQAVTPQSIEERIGNHLWGEETSEDTAAETAADTAADTADDDQAEETAEGQNPASPAVDEVEVEVEGWKGKIPTRLKAEIDKGADYTRKTQELSESRKLLDVQVRTYQEQQAFMQAAGQEMDQLRQIEAQLEQYRGVDLSQIDSETLSRMSMAAANLREERAKLKESIDGKRGQFKQRLASSWDEMTARAREAIVKTIPNWDSVASEVAQYALNEGFPFEHITGHDRATRERVGPGVVDPVFAKTLHKAMQWDKLQASKATSIGKAAKAPPVLKPGATDTRSNAQIGLMNFRKAVKNAGSDSRKAELIGDRVASKFFS